MAAVKRDRLPRHACILAGFALLAAFACGGAEGETAAVGAAPPAAHIVFQVDGVPGPWWRPGGTGDTFETDHRVCLVRSRDARNRPGEHDPADAAYRGFLDCMRQLGWVRGLPPRGSPPAGAAGA